MRRNHRSNWEPLSTDEEGTAPGAPLHARAKQLFDDHGVTFDPALRDEVLARYATLDVPSYTAFVMPRLTAVGDGSGAITDVEISYPQSLEQQMLEWSGRRAPAPVH